VQPREVVDVCSEESLVQQTHSGRLSIIGRTSAGRVLRVILAPVGTNIYYPITAHDAGRRDRELFHRMKG
jgi:hypothetical protein